MADNETNETRGESSMPEAPGSEEVTPPEAAPDSPAPEAAGPERVTSEAGTRAGPGAVEPAANGDQAGISPEGEAAGAARGRGDRGREDRGREDRGRERRDEGGRFRREREEPSDGIEENVVRIYRCSTVVKGGRRFSFAALVVVGDRNGRVGVGYGKANEVPNAVAKGTKIARRNMIQIQYDGRTIPHQVSAKYRASKVRLIPAGEGTGVIAGASVRAVMELAGVKDVLTKVYGSTSPKNLVKAAALGLQSLRSKEQVSKLREVKIA